MQILISTILGTKHKVGVSEYLIGLMNSLQQIDKRNDYFIITTKENRHFFNLTNNNFHEIIVNIWNISRATLRLQYLLFSKIQIPRFVKQYKIDVIHEPCSWFISKNISTIVTIHDVVELNNSKYSFLFNFLKQKMILSSINNSKAIISVSEQTTHDIKQIDNRNINTIHNGIPLIQKSKYEISSGILNKYNLKSKEYFIFVGTLLRHKNILTLLEAFREFYKTNSKYKLVLAGKNGNEIKNIRVFIKKWKLEKQIILTGYFDDNEKSSLIENAISLLLVSKNEGFGFPILEAQSLDIPVITSNTSSMKEIAQDSAILINPNSFESIASGMNYVVTNNQEILELIKLGRENIKRFSWIKSAKETIEVYTATQNNSLNR